jgi:hypothetical protein
MPGHSVVDPNSALTLISVPDSDPNPIFLIMKNTFELHLCSSSKHRKKADLFKPVHFWIRIVDEKYI